LHEYLVLRLESSVYITMAIITFTSDFGMRDHYVAAVKARIFNYNSNIQVIDITHNVEHFDVAHGAFVLSSVFRDFPKGTVHLVSVNSLSNSADKFIAVRLEEHLFVGTDNGLFSLLSDKTPIVVELNYDKSNVTTFPEKNVFAFAAVSLASGKNIYDLGPTLPPDSLKKMINRRLKVTKNLIEGNVIHIDAYGNAITNITKKNFDEMRMDREFFVQFGREEFQTIQSLYNQADSGDCSIVFNDTGLMEISINSGNASNLLGLQFDSIIRIGFHPEI
jgi:S-adenosylmethionine hydrolase